MRGYPETHQEGTIFIEPTLSNQRLIEGDLGIQIAVDGRIWICVDGVAFIRFSPKFKRKKQDSQSTR